MMHRSVALAGASALFFLSFLSTQAAAVVVFDTIAPTGVTTGGSGVFVGSTGGINYERAASFSVSGSDDYLLTGIDLLLDDGGTEVRLWSNSVDEPGTLLDFGTAPGSPVVNDLFSVDFAGGALLEAGETYWLSVYRATGSTAWRYASNGPYLGGNRMNNQNGGPWQDSSPRSGQLYGFTVHGTVVPEPSTLLLVGLGVAALSLRRTRGTAQGRQTP